MAPKKKGGKKKKKSSGKKSGKSSTADLIKRVEPVPVVIAPARGADALLLQAIVDSNADDVSRLFAAWPALDVNRKEHGDVTPLHFAAERGLLPIATLLLSYGADTGAKTTAGRTALMVAAAGGHRGVVTALVQGGADVNAQDARQMTALHLACINGDTNTVDTLLGLGADAGRADADGRTPWYWANLLGHDSLKKALPEPSDPYDVWKQYEAQAWFKDAIKTLEAAPKKKGKGKKVGKKKKK
ncbi:Ankyrin repeat domain-containing protein [Plasmodiophora brassicae]|nr:hypothetical protein PBRA_000553 [Plasmodiophora brassicae]